MGTVACTNCVPGKYSYTSGDVDCVDCVGVPRILPDSESVFVQLSVDEFEKLLRTLLILSMVLSMLSNLGQVVALKSLRSVLISCIFGVGVPVVLLDFGM